MGIIIATNILGFGVGAVIFAFLFPYVLQAINYVISIPVLGDLIRFGTEHAYIVFPYSAIITSALAAVTTFLICRPTPKGRKIGVTVLGIYMFIRYVFLTVSLFQLNGYDFVFVVFAVVALAVCAFIIFSGIHIEDKVENTLNNAETLGKEGKIL